MKLATKRKLSLWMMAVAIAAVAFSTWYYRLDRYGSDITTEILGNKLERSLKRIAGENARNCGTIFVPRDSTITNNCPEALSTKDGTFYSVYAVSSNDGTWYRGVARGSDGTYKEYKWRPTPEERDQVFAGPDPQLVPCADAHTLRKTWQNVVTCTADR